MRVLLCSVVVVIAGLLDVFAQRKASEKCDEYYGSLEKNLSITRKDVAGGYSAGRGQLPFMAALGYQVGNDIGYLCGGSLISEDFVVTAAHCIYSKSGMVVKYVRLGDLDLNSTEDDEYVQMFQVKKYYFHPEYKFPEKYHDIALIKLNKSATLLGFIVKPICMSGRDKVKREFIVGGWGQLGYGMQPSNQLQIGFLYPYNMYICQKQFAVDYTLPSGVSNEHQLCAGPIGKITDTCEGDSGGPLAYAWGKAFYLAGITSFGKPCALGFFPAVYVSVSAHVAWIENIVWPDEETAITKEDLVKEGKSDSNRLCSRDVHWILLLLICLFMNRNV